MGEVRVVRAGSADEAGLGAGWRLLHRSWGARLRLSEPFDPAPFEVATARPGLPIGELAAEGAQAVLALERANRQDYPGGPATAAPDLDDVTVVGLWHRGRVFGAWDGGRLVAVTALHVARDLAETDFTSVAASHRGRGLATAVKAASILMLAAEGRRVFATGGADENVASLRMNERLGYVVVGAVVHLGSSLSSKDLSESLPLSVVIREAMSVAGGGLRVWQTYPIPRPIPSIRCTSR